MILPSPEKTRTLWHIYVYEDGILTSRCWHVLCRILRFQNDLEEAWMFYFYFHAPCRVTATFSRKNTATDTKWRGTVCKICLIGPALSWRHLKSAKSCTISAFHINRAKFQGHRLLLKKKTWLLPTHRRCIKWHPIFPKLATL